MSGASEGGVISYEVPDLTPGEWGERGGRVPDLTPGEWGETPEGGVSSRTRCPT